MRNWYKEWDELCRFAGDNALAAVGSCVALVGIFVNLIVGLSVGPNAVLANLIGQNKRDKINDMLHTILTFGMLLGVILMLIGWLSARSVLELSGTPASVLEEALLYIRIYFVSIPFMVIYNFGAAALRGMGKSLEPAIFTILGTVVFRLIWLGTIFKWFPTYEMLMNVYVASWIFTGAALFVVYILHMKKVTKTFE